jgi:hypothetical protein
MTDAVIVHFRTALIGSSAANASVAAIVAIVRPHSTDSALVIRSRRTDRVTTHIPGANGHGSIVRPPAPPRRRRRRSPVVVLVLGRWFQALAGVAVMFGLGVAQSVMLKARGQLTAAAATLAAFVVLALVFFFIGRGLIHGRRWAWRGGAVLIGTVFVFLFYAVAYTPQPMAQRHVGLGATVLLFGVPVALLGLPSVRAFFASLPPDPAVPVAD